MEIHIPNFNTPQSDNVQSVDCKDKYNISEK